MTDKQQSSGDNSSVLKLYSMGVAAANIEFGQVELEVTPLEVTAHLDGEISDVQVGVTSSGVDREGNVYSTSQKASNSIKATYLPMNPHQPFPSLIRRGERVLIWRLSDSDKYYWQPMGLDATIRRTDIFSLIVANSPKEGENSQTHETAYFLEINTVSKHITIQTNKNDGEQYAYIFQMNPKDGAATLCDDAGNHFQLVSTDSKVSMKNAAGGEVTIDRNMGLIKHPKMVKIDSPKFYHNNKNVGDTHQHGGVYPGGAKTQGPS